MKAPWWWSKTETCRSDIYVYFNVNFNVFFKLKIVFFGEWTLELLKIFLWGRIKQVWRCLTILYFRLGSKIVTCISNRLPPVDWFSDLRKGSTLDIPWQPRRNKPRAFSLFDPLHPKRFWPVKWPGHIAFVGVSWLLCFESEESVLFRRLSAARVGICFMGLLRY